jgi:ketosteroid isomerase-like protein
VIDVLERYFDAMRRHDWVALSECLADDVHRTGPYLDVVEGQRAYTDFLAGVLPTLPSYTLTVHRIRRLGDHSAVVELSETLEVGGVSTEYPELLLFDIDGTGRIARVDVYIKQPPHLRS